jgi:hypothetical protein
MFAVYLDIQKQKDIEELDEGEVKGRWKSFIHKWCVVTLRIAPPLFLERTPEWYMLTW